MAFLPYPRSQNNSPTDGTDFHRFTGAWEVPQNSQNSKHTPSVRICEICGRTSSASLFCRRVENNPPTDCTDLHRFTGAWEVPQNTQNSQNSKNTTSVRICEICGRTSSANLFCEFCGRTPSASLFCEFREFCGGHPLQVCSVNSENSVGEHPLQVCFVGG
nr:MAG TPA: zinc-ribbon family protein [Caudoviricetes sp.]